MDEVFARRDLIETGQLRQLCATSDAAGFRQLGSHLGAIALTGLLLHATLGISLVVPASSRMACC